MPDTKTPKKKKGDHCIIRNGKLFCSHCGQSQDLPMPMRTEMFAAMGKTFTKMHKNCEPTWKEPEADLEQSVTARAHWWIVNGETGNSSKAIWAMMTTGHAPNNFPYDPDDFSRCYKLLQAIPEWKERLGQMGKVSAVWKNLVDNWEELTRMFEHRDEGMYDYMQNLIEKGRRVAV